jgi:hypothetical protein
MLETLPRIIKVDDYHTLKYLPEDIKNYLGINIKCKELGCDIETGDYIGIVYQGRCPNKQTIKKMLKTKYNDTFDLGLYTDD